MTDLLLVIAAALSGVVVGAAGFYVVEAFRFLRSLSPRELADLLEKRWPAFLPAPRSIWKGPKGVELYLRRFYLTPHWFPVRLWLHYIARSDEDRALHSHPWNFATLILRNGYVEELPGGRSNVRKAGSLAFRSAEDLHRVRLFLDESGKERPTWTLMFAGDARLVWGFEVEEQGRRYWVPWRIYLNLPDAEDHGEDVPLNKRAPVMGVRR